MDAICKGDWRLGSACTTCSRCIETAPAAARMMQEKLRERGAPMFLKNARAVSTLALAREDLPVIIDNLRDARRGEVEYTYLRLCLAEVDDGGSVTRYAIDLDLETGERLFPALLELIDTRLRELGVVMEVA